jgi:hypothetical protein
VVLEEAVEAATPDEGGEGVHVADVDQDRPVPLGGAGNNRVPQGAEYRRRAGVHQGDPGDALAQRRHPGHPSGGSA